MLYFFNSPLLACMFYDDVPTRDIAGFNVLAKTTWRRISEPLLCLTSSPHSTSIDIIISDASRKRRPAMPPKYYNKMPSAPDNLSEYGDLQIIIRTHTKILSRNQQPSTRDDRAYQ